MKWKTNEYKPKEGDRRTVRRFAFFPKQCIGGYTVWLETYDSVLELKLMTQDRFTIRSLEWVEVECHYLELYL